MTEKGKPISTNWNDPDDGPEWANDQFSRAEVRRGEKVIRPANGTLAKPGRPKLENPKRQVTLRLDAEIIEHFRATGKGWQTKINEVLKKSVEA